MWERIVIWSANRFRRYHLFDVDIANTGTDITSLPEFRQADVIHLHWVNQGMLSLKDIRKILNFRQTCGMDHARYVAMYRHLPLRTGNVKTISKSVTTALTSTKAVAGKIYLTALSAKNKSYTATLPSISSRAVTG